MRRGCRRARATRSICWCKTNGPDLYSRYLIPHYGHIDCIFGQNAHRDVYPVILEAFGSDTMKISHRSQQQTWSP